MTLRGSILNEADVVAATLSSSGKQQFLDHILQEELDFDTAIVDEAAQTTEPSTLIPLRYGCRSLVLVGDPRQLPATVLSPRAERAGLGRSLFERLEGAGHEVVMLTVQYRMHPDIRVFPSETFYQGLLYMLLSGCPVTSVSHVMFILFTYAIWLGSHFCVYGLQFFVTHIL
jgi:senataxin